MLDGLIFLSLVPDIALKRLKSVAAAKFRGSNSQQQRLFTKVKAIKQSLINC